MTQNMCQNDPLGVKLTQMWVINPVKKIWVTQRVRPLVNCGIKVNSDPKNCFFIWLSLVGYKEFLIIKRSTGMCQLFCHQKLISLCIYYFYLLRKEYTFVLLCNQGKLEKCPKSWQILFSHFDRYRTIPQFMGSPYLQPQVDCKVFRRYLIGHRTAHDIYSSDDAINHKWIYNNKSKKPRSRGSSSEKSEWNERFYKSE